MNREAKAYLSQILTKFRKGTVKAEEANFIEALDDVFEQSEDLINSDNESEYLWLKNSIKLKIDSNISSIYKKKPFKISRVTLARAAAVIFIVCALVSVYLINSRKSDLNAQRSFISQKIQPGTDRAVLTLGNGKKVLLSPTSNGLITEQSGAAVVKAVEGRLIYSLNNNTTPDQEPVFNTISTPNGGQYQVTLPDGSKVWLNATSSLTFPTAFTGDERLVKLVGEGYFEVVKNPKMPFRVQSGLQTVEVLGTHFNVNAYPDEVQMETTLAEGSVKVDENGNSLVIAPGEQIVADRLGYTKMIKRRIDLDKELAWKNGVFAFNGQDIGSIMRQVGRWYNVTVNYAPNMPQERFYGEISRNSSLNDVLRILELNNVRFKVEGHTITVLPRQMHN